MAAATPIVASDLPSLRDVLQHESNALLVNPEDPQAFALAIRRLIENPELAQRLGLQAHQDVEQYSWDSRAARLLDVIAMGNAHR
jgi:glycosyltransferase involved in cell wall biosynthesis